MQMYIVEGILINQLIFMTRIYLFSIALRGFTKHVKIDVNFVKIS